MPSRSASSSARWVWLMPAYRVRARCPASTIFAGWRQSVLPVHLLGLAPLLGSVGPVAGDVKLQDDGVVHDPVNRRGGGHVTREGGFRTEPCCLGYGSAAPLGTASALAPRWVSLDELQPFARENVAKRGGSR